MAVICSSSNPTQLRALLTVVDPDDDSRRDLVRRGRRARPDAALRRRRGGDRGAGGRCPLGRRPVAQRRPDRRADLGPPPRRPRQPGGCRGSGHGQPFKAALHSETGASAVDMESHIAAAYAAEAGLPFAAVRVISDPAHRALPALARAAIKPNGQIDLAPSCAASCAIRGPCTRWSRPASTSTARCAPCAAAATF